MAKYKRIRDIIYGLVQLDEQEVEIIDNTAFQRLRRIKQLALTDLVYPGAMHTRFEHSIGVMQMATDMFDNIVNKIPDSSCFKDIRGDEEKRKRYRKIVRLAALLHDVGHAPFSHANEELFPKKPDGRHYKHEDYSIAIIKECFKNVIEDHVIGKEYGIKVSDIAYLLNDEKAPATKELIFLRPIISSQIDADRMDYLLRDSVHLGVKYGIYDKDRLIGSLRITNGDDNIGIDEKSYYNAESLIIARYQMFSQVYYHKVRRIYDYHISEATKCILKALKQKNSCFPSPDKVQEYLKFDDWYINRYLDEKGGEHGKIILSRKHYKALDKEINEKSTHMERKDFDEFWEAKKNNNSFYLDDGRMKSFYDEDDNKEIIIIGKDGKDKLLTEKSRIIESMKFVTPKFKRIYEKRN